MLTHTIAGQDVGHIITIHLLTVIAFYAILILAARRSWLKPAELPLIAGAMIFWAVAWLLQPVIPIVRTRFPELLQAVPISVALITPIIGVMIYGVLYVKKKMIALQLKQAGVPPVTTTKLSTKRK